MLGDVNVRVSLVSILVQIVSQALRLKTIRIYRLHAWPEIKRFVSFVCCRRFCCHFLATSSTVFMVLSLESFVFLF